MMCIMYDIGICDVSVKWIGVKSMYTMSMLCGHDVDDRTDYIDLYPNNDLNRTCAPENISDHFGLLFLRAPYKFQFYFTLLYLSNFVCH